MNDDGAAFEKNRVSKALVQTRFSDTDAMGIVHHSRFFDFFEIARETYMQKRGVDFSAIFFSGNTLPLSAAGIHFQQPIRFAQTIVIEACLAHLNRARLRFEYRILRNDPATDSVLASGWTEHIYTDMQLKLCRVPRQLMEQLLGPERPDL